MQVEMMQLEVDGMQAEAASARAAAESSQAAVLEVERLGQDNALLAARLSQMDLDLQVLSLQASSEPFSRLRLLPKSGPKHARKKAQCKTLIVCLWFFVFF